MPYISRSEESNDSKVRRSLVTKQEMSATFGGTSTTLLLITNEGVLGTFTSRAFKKKNMVHSPGTRLHLLKAQESSIIMYSYLRALLQASNNLSNLNPMLMILWRRL
jgi:hypothetical protein